MANSLTERILTTARRFSMIDRGDLVLVAVSGGPDSVALLHALWTMRDDLGITLHVAHLNHSFRGEESDADAEYTRGLASELGLSATIEKVDVPLIQSALRVSPEEAARMARYEFLEKTAESVGASRIAVAHTADDQCETVLLNVLRGAGIDGLSGMPPVRGKIIRPLIEVRRKEVETYLADRGLVPRQDSTNLTPAYTRNRIRLELLPSLRQDFNSDMDAGLLRLAELARADTAYLNSEADAVLAQIMPSSEDNSLLLDAAKLAECALPIRRRVVRLAVKRLRGEIADIGYVHVEEFLRLLDFGKDFVYGFPGGTYAKRTGCELALQCGLPVEMPISYCCELAVPGETAVPEIEVVIVAELSKHRVDHIRPRSGSEVVLDFAAVQGRVTVRNWQPGDRMRPLGLGGSKKVQDIFTDAKIPRAARCRVPLIVDEEKALWVAGLAISDEVKVTENTEEFLEIKVISDGCCPRKSCVV